MLGFVDRIVVAFAVWIGGSIPVALAAGTLIRFGREHDEELVLADERYEPTAIDLSLPTPSRV